VVEAVSVLLVEDPGHDPMDGQSRNSEGSTRVRGCDSLSDNVVVINRIDQHPKEVSLGTVGHLDHRSTFDS
jgi:hypothetical protein